MTGHADTIFLGRPRQDVFAVHHGEVTEQTNGTIGIPALHVWAIPDPGDSRDDVLGALGEALSDLWRLVLVIGENNNPFPDAVFAIAHTDYEHQLCLRFCEMVEVTTGWSDLPLAIQTELLKRFPKELKKFQAPEAAAEPVTLTKKMMRVFGDRCAPYRATDQLTGSTVLAGRIVLSEDQMEELDSYDDDDDD